jgi:uncharacterized membrane protein
MGSDPSNSGMGIGADALARVAGARDPFGFRLRGGRTTRLEAFVDAAFAFALTLMVIAVGSVPRTPDELAAALKGVPAFAACFWLIATFWRGHVDWSERFGLDDPRSRQWSLLLIFLTLMLPVEVRIMPTYEVVSDLGLINSMTGLTLPLIASATGTLLFRQFFLTIPDELEEAARIDGAGFWRIFLRIVLPMSTPILMVTLIWQFTNIWNDFLFGVAFSGADSKPVTVGLNNMANTTSSVKNYNVDMAAAIIAGLPTMLVYVLAGQYFVKGLTAGAVKG